MSGSKKNSPSGEGYDGPDAVVDSTDDAAQTQISRQLRAFYDSVQEEGIPDRFLDLLQKLDEAEKAQANRG